MIKEIFNNTLMITTFVMVMMLIIEFFNVRSKGIWSDKISKSKWLQLILAAFLGITPGCLGAYTVVSLYTHNIVNFGALVTVLIATSGDEAFVMFSMFPSVTIKLTIILFIIAIVTGYIVNIAYKNKRKPSFSHYKFPIHKDKVEHQKFNFKFFIGLYKNISFQRAILIFGLLLFIIGLSFGDFGHSHFAQEGHEGLSLPHEIARVSNNNTAEEYDTQLVTHDEDSHSESEHESWNWITITFLISSVVALLIVITSPDHFLDHHLWDHIIKKHFMKIFLWTFGALLIIHFVVNTLHLETWLQSNQVIILIVAVLIGLIPESGPHLIFVTLFFEGTIPFSTLLASSIVQDGHGALPLFAESKRSFVIAKLINLAVGLAVGLFGLFF